MIDIELYSFLFVVEFNHVGFIIIGPTFVRYKSSGTMYKNNN